MYSIVGLGIFALGIVLLIFGLNAFQSFGSNGPQYFTGNPNNESLWLIAAGGASVAVGLFVALRARRE